MDERGKNLPIRDPRLRLAIESAALEQQKAAKDLAERPVWSGYVKHLRELRLNHMEEIVRNHDSDIAYERAVCDVLAIMITAVTYDERIVAMRERRVEALREEIRSLQDVDLLPKDDPQPGDQQ